MRVISGNLKGFRLSTPKGNPLRPTTDRVKEALFQILSDTVQGIHFLDLFSGTGNVGIEAISRGAFHAHLVESNPKHLSVIKANIAKCRIQEKITLYSINVFTFLKKANQRKDSFGIIFLDPPYFKEETEQILSSPELIAILKERGCVIVEHFHKRPIVKVPPGLKKEKDYRYGDSILSFFRKEQ